MFAVLRLRKRCVGRSREVGGWLSKASEGETGSAIIAVCRGGWYVGTYPSTSVPFSASTTTAKMYPTCLKYFHLINRQISLWLFQEDLKEGLLFSENGQVHLSSQAGLPMVPSNMVKMYNLCTPYRAKKNLARYRGSL